MNKEDHYATLGLNKNASSADIKKAYKKLALQAHPDKGGSAQEFQKISEAFSVLSDPKQREEYDAGGFNQKFGGFSSDSGNFRRRPFSQQDAFSMFDNFFADFRKMHSQHFGDNDFFNDDPFESMMGGSMIGQMMRGGSGRGFGGGFGSGFGAGFSDPFFSSENFGQHSTGSSMSYSSSYSSSGGITQGKSVSTRTTIENGKKVTIQETTTIGKDGKRHTEVQEFRDDVGPKRIGEGKDRGKGKGSGGGRYLDYF